MDKAQLRSEYATLYGKKPHHSWDEDKLQELIDDMKSKDNPEIDLPEPEQVEEIKPDKAPEPIKATEKVVDGKRHKVYKKGVEVWWTKGTIDVMLASFPNDITFPENTQYIVPPKKCATCG